MSKAFYKVELRDCLGRTFCCEIHRCRLNGLPYVTIYVEEQWFSFRIDVTPESAKALAKALAEAAEIFTDEDERKGRDACDGTRTARA